MCASRSPPSCSALTGWPIASLGPGLDPNDWSARSDGFPSSSHDRRRLMQALACWPITLMLPALSACGSGDADRGATPQATVQDRRVPLRTGVALHVRDWNPGNAERVVVLLAGREPPSSSMDWPPHWPIARASSQSAGAALVNRTSRCQAAAGVTIPPHWSTISTAFWLPCMSATWCYAATPLPETN